MFHTLECLLHVQFYYTTRTWIIYISRSVVYANLFNFCNEYVLETFWLRNRFIMERLALGMVLIICIKNKCKYVKC